jgi:Pyruvate/2-oxoacid:ferredoxin oxidoreductase delta subunit
MFKMSKNQSEQFKLDNWNPQILQQIKTLEDWRTGITIPVKIEIKAEHKVLNLDKAISYLDKAKNIYKLDCICRTMLGKCDSPLDTCIGWDSIKPLIDSDIYKNQNAREITKEEAIETLKKSSKAGLVHMAYAMMDDQVNRICSCCSCCCAVFSSVLKYKMFPGLIISDSTTTTDDNLCDNCGACIERCHFKARSIEGNKLEVHKDICFGCGLCVPSCSKEAISLVEKI